MSMWLMVVIIVVVITCGQVVQQAIESFSQKPRSLPGTEGAAGAADGEEVLRLREQLESLADQVERLQEEQRFLTNLLEERPPPRLETRSQRPGSETRPGRGHDD